MFSFFSPFERPAFSLSPSWLPSALPIYCAPYILLVPCRLSTVQLSPAKCPPSTHTSFPLTPLLPLSIHHALTLASPLPSLPPSRDNYYKPCEDQLVFKQLNKQGLGLLTVTIQQQSTKPKKSRKSQFACGIKRRHLKTSPLDLLVLCYCVPCNEHHSRVKIHLYVASLSLWPQIQAQIPNVHIQIWLGGF